MAEPIIYGDAMHLDAVLAWASFDRHDPKAAGFYLPALDSAWPVDFNLPLSIWTAPAGDEQVDDRLMTRDGLLWGFCSSAAIIDAELHRTHEVRKRVETGPMARYSGSPTAQIGTGATKAFDLKFPTVWAREIRWYACGDKRGVADLLGRITHLGKKRSMGMGRVMRWDVSSTDADYSMRWNGMPMRVLPASMFPGRPADVMGVRPPYWHHSRRALCVSPDGNRSAGATFGSLHGGSSDA